MDRAYVVLTAVGPDRLGIVDDLSTAASEAGCNIEESKMAVLGGEFAVIMLVSGGAAAIDTLCKSIPLIGEKLSLHVECRPTREPSAPDKGRPYLLEAIALDTPGIVQSVSAILRSHGINIEELETDTAAAPWTGAPMFRMKAQLLVGPSVSIARLKEDLFRLQEEHDLDIALKPVFPALSDTP